MATALIAQAVTLKKLFGSKEDIADTIRNFDFSKMDVKDSTKQDFLTMKLAPSLGTLTSESIKAMDEHLKVLIAATNRAISKLEDRSWDKVISTLAQNPVIEPLDDGTARADKLIKNGTNYFKFDGAPDPTVVKEVESWFHTLISDEDILKATPINIVELANIVGQSGATVDDLITAIHKVESHEKTVVDIGVLRYPDLTHPYFKVYRIKLTAWSRSDRTLFVQDDSNGITGEFNVRRFKPREEVMAGMKKEVLAKAAKEADDFFA